MHDRSTKYTFLWGPVPVSVATVVLTIWGLRSNDQPIWSWMLIVLCGVFIVVHAAMAAVRDRSIVFRLGRHYDQVQRMCYQVVADLGELTGNQFDLWMVDLYLPARTIQMWRWPFRQQVLSRQITASLVDTRPQEPSVDSRVGPHGQCFTSGKRIIWFDENDLRLSGHGRPSVDNLWESLEEAQNAKLAASYGVISVSPLVTQHGRNCVGVLAIHVAPEPDKAIRAHGALSSVEGQRRITNACVALNGLLT